MDRWLPKQWYLWLCRYWQSGYQLKLKCVVDDCVKKFLSRKNSGRQKKYVLTDMSAAAAVPVSGAQSSSPSNSARTDTSNETKAPAPVPAVDSLLQSIIKEKRIYTTVAGKTL